MSGARSLIHGLPDVREALIRGKELPSQALQSPTTSQEQESQQDPSRIFFCKQGRQRRVSKDLQLTTECEQQGFMLQMEHPQDSQGYKSGRREKHE